MKWPKTLVLIRHAESEYNARKQKKAADADYQQFVAAFDRDPQSHEARWLHEDQHSYLLTSRVLNNYRGELVNFITA